MGDIKLLDREYTFSRIVRRYYPGQHWTGSPCWSPRDRGGQRPQHHMIAKQQVTEWRRTAVYFMCATRLVCCVTMETTPTLEGSYMQRFWIQNERSSYCWNKSKSDPTKFTLGTWSNKISRSTILKSGNARDREKLSEATNRNKVRPNKTRNKKKAEKPLYPSRQRRRIEKQQDRTQHDCQSNNDDGDDAFGDAFRDVPLLDMTSHQAQRDQEFKEQTDREIEDG